MAALAACSVSAQGIIDNSADRNRILSAAVEFDSGDYVVQNVATKEYLRFSRPADTTNVHGHSDYGTVHLEHGGEYGVSGRKTGDWSGTIISGDGKCGSAQWGLPGLDIAFVSYACKTGKDGHLGTDSLEVAKQFWRIVPCGNQGQNEGDDDDDDETRPNVKLNVVKGGSKDNNGVEFSGKKDDKQSDENESKPKPTPAPTANKKGNGKYGDWVPQTTKSVNPYDRSSWVCRHPGYWLHRHPAYVTEAGHVECKDDLEDYRASLKSKRSVGTVTHSTMARRTRRRRNLVRSSGPAKSLSKRAPSSGRYCIIAEDHLTDMRTRAVGSKRISTFGGYTSQELVHWDENDPAQQWDIYQV
ncbi:hypothetical protein OIV83_004991 [Microbotryomycetes sp. JL201]|nr:hypothetical protein OIV83_004991 [Microbotryomycetes sp. JL201]